MDPGLQEEQPARERLLDDVAADEERASEDEEPHGFDTIVRAVEDVRSLPALWPLRQRRHVVIVCLQDSRVYEDARREIEARGAELVVEREPGPLSAVLGRPAVVVADRFGTVGFRGERPAVGRVLAELEAFELACPECGPQAWGDPGL